MPCCPYTDYWDIPLNRINDEDNKEVTNAIIETAKMLAPKKQVIGYRTNNMEYIKLNVLNAQHGF